jgi:hypothetical protein
MMLTTSQIEGLVLKTAAALHNVSIAPVAK